MIRSISRAAALAAVVFAASAASAATLSSWNVGSGQDKDNFQLNSATFDNGIVQLGLRAQLRTLGSVAPSGDVYSIAPGTQSAPAVPAPNRARWNFDIHAFAAGGLANLDTLTLSIVSDNANQPTAVSFNLFDPTLNAAISSSNVGLGQDRASYLQASQNPVFAPWFTAPFDSFAPGNYRFTLTATRALGNSPQPMIQTISEGMTVTIVPTPTALPAGLALMIGGVLASRMGRNRLA
jgi:hypothetical protein